MRFAILLQPDLTGLVSNDEELYAEIREAGTAVILQLEDGNPFELEQKPVTLSAAEFQEQWRGD